MVCDGEMMPGTVVPGSFARRTIVLWSIKVAAATRGSAARATKTLRQVLRSNMAAMWEMVI